MKEDKEYFGRLYTNKEEWCNLTKREAIYLEEKFIRLKETVTFPIPLEVITKQFRITPQQVFEVIQYGDSILEEIRTLGIVDRKELSRFRQTMEKNIDNLIILKQDGKENEEILASINIPYDTKVWEELLKIGKKNGINFNSNSDINTVYQSLQNKVPIEKIINSSEIFKSKNDILLAIHRNNLEFSPIISKEELNNFKLQNNLKKKNDTIRIEL